MNNLFLSTTFCPDNTSLLKVLELCSETDISSIEIGSNHCFEESYNYLANYHFDYLVHNYFPIPKESFVLNIASFDESIRIKSIDHIKNAIDFCDNISAKLYTFHPGFLTDPHNSNISTASYDFQWDENQLSKANFDRAKSLMYDALNEIIIYASNKSVIISIETEGSFNKKDYLLMQYPKEYEEFVKKYTPQDIGVNLNIGHLNLAANAFEFKRGDFVDLIKNYIVAMELSHNDGIEDQHLPLKPDGWYWPLILDERFQDTYKILEFRNTDIQIVVDNINLVKEKANAI